LQESIKELQNKMSENKVQESHKTLQERIEICNKKLNRSVRNLREELRQEHANLSCAESDDPYLFMLWP
jgi:rRNA maturation endonuclease Nob1